MPWRDQTNFNLDASSFQPDFQLNYPTHTSNAIHHHHHHYPSSPESHFQQDIGYDNSKYVAASRSPIGAGLESVLRWNVFPKPLPYSTLPNNDEVNTLVSHALPCADLTELLRLEAKFIENVHMKNPIINLRTLRQLILRCAENGLEWSSSTCLVTLVCALGAISRRYKPQSGINELGSNEETRLAWQYWAVATKRLGFVIGKSDLESVQCLCLTGFDSPFLLMCTVQLT